MWLEGKNLQYLLPSEIREFQKEALAIAFHEVDEAVLDRQSSAWLDRLLNHIAAQQLPGKG